RRVVERSEVVVLDDGVVPAPLFGGRGELGLGHADLVRVITVGKGHYQRGLGLAQILRPQPVILDVGGQTAAQVDAPQLHVVRVAAEQAINRFHAVVQADVQGGGVVQPGTAFQQVTLEG